MTATTAATAEPAAEVLGDAALGAAGASAPAWPAGADLGPVAALSVDFELPETVAPSEAARLAAEAAGPQVRQGVRIGELALMLRYDEGSELVEAPTLHRLPNAPDWLQGLCNLHGVAVPVVDLTLFLGLTPAPAAELPERAAAQRRLLVLSRGVDAAAVPIDGLPSRLRFDAEHRAEADAAPLRLLPHLRGAARLDNRLWLDVDVTALLNAIEAALAA